MPPPLHRNSVIESVRIDLTPTFKDLKHIRDQRKSKKLDNHVEEAEHVPEGNVFNRLSLSGRSSAKKVNTRSGSVRQAEDPQSFENDKWRIMNDVLDAHKSQVFALASYDTQLYSGANKSIKFWDLSTA
jgi:hypothetical protein